MGSLSGMDAAIFRLVNSAWTAPFLDAYMTFVTAKMNFLGAIIVAAALIWILGKRQDRVGLVLLVILVVLSDFVSNELKGVFVRVRPCNAMDGVRLLVGCGGSYSMPSGHATNIFAAMAFLSMRYRRFSPAFMFMAISVAYSRVYVGVHYPLDVLAGAVLGSSMALAFYSAERGYLRQRLVAALASFREGRGARP